MSDVVGVCAPDLPIPKRGRSTTNGKITPIWDGKSGKDKFHQVGLRARWRMGSVLNEHPSGNARWIRFLNPEPVWIRPPFIAWRLRVNDMEFFYVDMKLNDTRNFLVPYSIVVGRLI